MESFSLKLVVLVFLLQLKWCFKKLQIKIIFCSAIKSFMYALISHHNDKLRHKTITHWKNLSQNIFQTFIMMHNSWICIIKNYEIMTFFVYTNDNIYSSYMSVSIRKICWLKLTTLLNACFWSNFCLVELIVLSYYYVLEKTSFPTQKLARTSQTTNVVSMGPRVFTHF